MEKNAQHALSAEYFFHIFFALKPPTMTLVDD